MINEAEYARHWSARKQREQKAASLYADLCDLFAETHYTQHQMLLRARLDNLITAEELNVLRECGYDTDKRVA